MNPEINRRKASMVLHELEIALGNYVVNREISVDNISNKLIEDIAKRELSRNRNIDTNSIRDIVEATYLDEIFQITLEITSDTSSNKYLRKLKELFVLYDIYEIRNVISHPNRKFIDSYWYKVASIASDPIIDVLGIDEVKKALISAENGDIIDPPDEWLKNTVWSIPNNIPDNFEHAITGLVGRKKEGDLLLKSLVNPRINTVAIVAPGGLGKTALALDLIADQMSLPETKSWCDGCLFVSMKTERLTAEGLKKLNAVETIGEIKDQLAIEACEIFDENFDSFDDFASKYSNQKILLFIDNLETLLTDSPYKFEEFNMSLPHMWRVLVTSRIAISHASIVTLDPLKNASAAHMARMYSTRRGGESQNDSVYDNIAKHCHCNPLAIRLTVDLYLSGKEIPASIDVANKEIASFSYNNLIEKLSDNAIKILEALFVDDKSSRLELCELLDINKDELALGVSELSNTSLITRVMQDESEKFALSSSVRELLLTNPRNISIRSKIQASINRKKVLALEIDAKQQRKNISWFDLYYIPSDTNESLKILLTELNSSIRRNLAVRHDRAISLYKKFKEAEYLNEKNALFQRGYATLLGALNATDDAIRHYKVAIELDEKNPGHKLFLGVLYHRNSDFENAIKIYEALIDEGWAEVKSGDDKLAYQVTQGYFLALLFGHQYERILEKTKNWKKDENFRGLLGAYRASAWKRKCEDIVNVDPEKTMSYLTSAMRILDDVFRNDGYIKSASMQAKSIFNEVAYALSRKEYSDNEEFTSEALGFIEKHLRDTMEYAKYSDTDETIKLINKLAEMDIKNNPFEGKKVKQGYLKSYRNGIEASEAVDRNLVISQVVRTPKGRTGNNTFMFAMDTSGIEYFLHYDQLMNGSWNEWDSIKTGDRLAIKPSKHKPKSGDAKLVAEIHLVSA